ncbi:alanyl-tRNA editing protein [Rhodoferax sp.]|uniref:alanyl-tRNA editing protein n=1 Tax=Rhodoferax sp. TaxID=50421 RepID=UPI0028445BDB|nr:alanyl-tRNA editing protein [Rhodoferax sp.]MDR3367623.1 alanyl-tRNA editing protein [Rhodoferax sp.]
MTQKLFWSDPYQTKLSTTVVTVSGGDITLSETIFFAFSGGQESDTGTIDNHAVLVAQKRGVDVVYTLAENHDLKPGQSVVVQIDWTRRYQLMRLHFAAELVLELFYRHLGGVNKVGAHIAQDKARIDFAWPVSISPLLPMIESDANSIIAANMEIITAFDDEPNERRYWEISGFSRVPCGGTHVKRTGEIGPIKLKRNNKGRGNERVEIYLTT